MLIFLFEYIFFLSFILYLWIYESLMKNEMPFTGMSSPSSEGQNKFDWKLHIVWLFVFTSHSSYMVKWNNQFITSTVFRAALKLTIFNVDLSQTYVRDISPRGVRATHHHHQIHKCVARKECVRSSSGMRIKCRTTVFVLWCTGYSNVQMI